MLNYFDKRAMETIEHYKRTRELNSIIFRRKWYPRLLTTIANHATTNHRNQAIGVEHMTMLVCYPSKKAMKECIGKPLKFRETSMFGEEYNSNGTLTVAYRPTIWKHHEGGREFFARVTMEYGLIKKVD